MTLLRTSIVILFLALVSNQSVLLSQGCPVGGGCTANCNFFDGQPQGAYASHICVLELSCSCHNGNPVSGHCRQDTCKKCSGQNSQPKAYFCMSQEACSLGAVASSCLKSCSGGEEE
jgi:hypothetical protein